jgi:hypothetical protein
MKTSALFITLIICSLFASSVSFATEQKVLFNVESIRYQPGTGNCQSICNSKYNDPPLKTMLDQGWRIISSSPKEAIGSNYWFLPAKYGRSHKCTCIGTQYILQKDAPVPVAKPDVPSKNEELLKKENELLKRENNLLKQEIKNLKDKLKLRQQK